MKKRILFYPVCIIALLFFCQIGYSQQKPLILTSTSDVASITKSIAGTTAEVLSAMQGGENPDYLVPTRRVELKSKDAKMFLKIGVGLESKWETALLNKSANPNISEGASGNIVVTDGIKVLPSTSADGKTDPWIHKQGNPYVWLNPVNGKIIAENIYKTLLFYFPQEKEYMLKNKKRFQTRLDKKIKQCKERMKPYNGLKVVAYNHNFDYFAKAFGIIIADYLEPAPGVPPKKEWVKHIIEQIKNQNIPLLIIADYNNQRIPRQIIKQTGADLVILPTSVGSEWVNEYTQIFDYITNKIHLAMKKRQAALKTSEQ